MDKNEVLNNISSYLNKYNKRQHHINDKAYYKAKTYNFAHHVIFQEHNLHAVLSSSFEKFINIKFSNRCFLKRVIKALEIGYSNPEYNRSSMAKALAISERHLQRKLKYLLNTSPNHLLRLFRLYKAKDLILQGAQVGLASNVCGFTSQSHFTKCFKIEFDMLPSALKALP